MFTNTVDELQLLVSSTDDRFGDFAAKVLIHSYDKGNHSFETAMQISPKDVLTGVVFWSPNHFVNWYVMPVESGAAYRFITKTESRDSPKPTFFSGRDVEQYSFGVEAGGRSVATDYSGYLWIRVTASSDEAAYEINIEESFDLHGNSPVSATLLSLPNDEQHGVLRHAWREYDYFAIDAVAGEIYQFQVNFEPERRRDKLRFDVLRTGVLRSQQELDDGELIYVSFAESERYFIVMANGQDSKINRYTMRVDRIGSSAIPIEPDVTHRVYEIGPSEVWYSVAVKAGSVYQFPTIDVFEQDRETRVGLAEPNQPFEPTKDGFVTFYLPTHPTRFIDQRILVTERKAPPPGPPVDVPRLEIPFTVIDRAILADHDWISFSVEAGRFYKETLELIDFETGEILSSETTTSKAPFSRVKHRELKVPQDVDFRFSISDEGEAARPEDAIPVSGQFIDGYLTDGFDIDWYKIDVLKGQIFDAESVLAGDIKTVLVLNENRVPPTSPIVTKDETYFIGVQDPDRNFYSVQLNVEANGPPRPLGEFGPIARRFDSKLRSDVYEFDTRAGQAYEVRLPEGSAHFQISDANGNFVNRNDEPATWRSRAFRWIAAADETVTISVADITSPFYALYTLDVSQPFGDANLDGVFDSSDFIVVFQAREYEDDIAGNSTWTEGDWDGDGDFTSSDLIKAFVEGNYEGNAEPPLAARPRIRDCDVAFRLLADDDFTVDLDQDRNPNPRRVVPRDANVSGTKKWLE
ncbi:hypothetical protein ACFL2H_03080 [Planctomycetota bacterium]